MGKAKTIVAKVASRIRPRSFTAKEVKDYEGMRAYRDQSISWVFATRGQVPVEVVDSWDTIQWPMNQFRSGRLTAKGMEVAAAYNALFGVATDRKMATKVMGAYAGEYIDAFVNAKFILTTEEDNIISPFAVQALLEAIHTCPDCGREIAAHCAGKKRPCRMCKEWRCEKGHKGYDGVGALYFVKRQPAIPMAFGDPKTPTDFKPRSVARAIKSGKVIEVNGIAMGCSLFRKDVFRQVSRPWFTTSSTFTQDLWFAKKAKKEAGARFGVHCGIQIGHLDVRTGEVI